MLSRISVCLLLLMSACSAPVKEYSEQIVVKSTNYRFIDELFAPHSARNYSVNVPVWVSYPSAEEFSPPYPAVVLLHSSWGLSAQESYYASVFKAMGLAVYAIDSFTPRGVAKTSTDQSRVSSASMLQDAFQVLNYLHTDQNINAEKVAVMGFSKGGIVALYSAFDMVSRAAQQKTKQTFAAHIAYYPWCGMRLNNMRTNAAPILLQGGDKDIITPINQCEQLIEETFNIADKQSVTVQHHPKARHAFDHPVLARVPIMLSLNAQVPALCDIRQGDSGAFIETHSNMQVNGANVKSVLEACSTYNGNASSNRKATRKALDVTKAFLTEHLLD